MGVEDGRRRGGDDNDFGIYDGCFIGLDHSTCSLAGPVQHEKFWYLA